MPNDILKLSDKRVLLAGPVTSYSYEIGYAFTSQGASVCYFTEDTDKAQRIADTLNDAREIHRNYGRATFAALSPGEKDIPKAVAAAVQTLSGLDIYIDALNVLNPKTPCAEVHLQIAQTVETIFFERDKGRFIFLLENFLWTHSESAPGFKEHRSASMERLQARREDMFARNVAAHVVRIGLSEDTLLFLYPQKTLNDGVKELNSRHPGIKLTKPDNISKVLLGICGDLLSPVPPTELTVL